MLVPLDILIWYLAVFRRLFAGMEGAAASRDREAMWLYQWAAYVLHNVPGMLQTYDQQSPGQTPDEMAERVLGFPELMAKWGAPPRWPSSGRG